MKAVQDSLVLYKEKQMKIDEKLDLNIELIKRHARVALTKVKKPTSLSLDDLIQEGVVVFLKADERYLKNRSASFKTYLTTCLRNHYTSLIKRTYRNKKVTGFPSWDNLQDDAFFGGINSLDAFEIVQLSFIIEDFSSDELKYVDAMLSFTHKHRKSRRKATREVLGITYEREQELRRSLYDKIKK